MHLAYTLYALACDLPPFYAIWRLYLSPSTVSARGAHSTSCNPLISTRFTPGRAEISPSIS
jgi:hypothetical protein